MDASQIINAVLEIVFSRYMLYLAPLLFLLMVVVFVDRFVDLLYEAISNKRRYR